MYKHSAFPPSARKLGWLVIAGFTAKGLLTSSLIAWALWSASGV